MLFIGFLLLIGPLYIVSREKLNAHRVRSFAIEQLRRIDASMGIRQAGLLADTASKGIGESLAECMSVPDCITDSLMPS
jgi:hypothetical protein